MDPYRTSVEGQRARAEQAKEEALAEYGRLTHFLLDHLAADLVARMDECRDTLDGDPPGDATMELWIAYEGHAGALQECVARAIEAAEDLRADLVIAGDPPPLEPGRFMVGSSAIEKSILKRALPGDLRDLVLRLGDDHTHATFSFLGAPIALDVYVTGDSGQTFVGGVGVARCGPPLNVHPSGIIRRGVLSTGDAAFDAMYSLQGTDSAIATWLTDPVRKGLVAIGQVDPVRLDIQNGGAVMRYSFGIEDPRPLRHLVKVLAALREVQVRIPPLVRKR
ncbi:hypothetical protein BH09MYX1_BH09MYX1_29130 [soil metagenome]